jgi:hypothetical protein
VRRRLDDRQVLELFHPGMLAVPLALAPTFIQVSTAEHVAGNFCDPDERQFLKEQTPLV